MGASVLLNGFVYAYFIGESMKGEWNTWERTFHLSEKDGGMAVTIANIAAMSFAPIILLVKM